MSIGGNEESTLEGTEPRGKRERSTSKGQKEARVAGFQRVERMILGEVGKVSRGQIKPNYRCGVLSRRVAY